MAQTENIIRIKNARLSFHSLDEHELYEGKDTGKYSATLLFAHGSNNQTIVEAAIQDALAAKWGKKIPARSKIKDTYRDGDDEKYDGYAGMMALKGTNKRRINVIRRDRSPIMPEEFEEWMYNGCYVNATVTFNAGVDGYKNNRVWCNLRAVQFYAHGDRFGGGTPVDIDDEFDEFDDDDDDIPSDMI